MVERTVENNGSKWPDGNGMPGFRSFLAGFEEIVYLTIIKSGGIHVKQAKD